MTEKISTLLIRIMLCIYIALMCLGILIGTLGKLENISYTFSLICAVILLLAAIYFRPRLTVKLNTSPKLTPLSAGILLSLFCFIINFIWILCFQIEPTVDFLTFYETAQRISRWEPIDWLYIGLFPHILGYSTFLGYFMHLFGDSPLLAPLLNVILTTVSGAAIYLLCLRWAGYRPAVFAFFFWSICPSKLMYNSMVMSEPLYTCLILLFLLLLSLLCDAHGSFLPRCLAVIPLSLICGAVLLAINVVRPVAMILLTAFFIWLLLLRGSELKNIKIWVLMLVFTAGMLTSYSFCSNKWDRWELLKVFEETSDIPGYNIYVGLNPESEGSFSEADMDLLLNYRYDQEHGSAIYAQEKMLEEAQARLNSGEINFPRLFAVKLGKLIGNDEGGAFYAKEELSHAQYLVCATISNIYYYVLVILSVFGAIVLYKKPAYTSVYMPVLYSIGLILAHLIIEVSGRYKYSIIPMLIILAAISLTRERAETLKQGNA